MCDDVPSEFGPQVMERNIGPHQQAYHCNGNNRSHTQNSQKKLLVLFSASCMWALGKPGDCLILACSPCACGPSLVWGPVLVVAGLWHVNPRLRMRRGDYKPGLWTGLASGLDELGYNIAQNWCLLASEF